MVQLHQPSVPLIGKVNKSLFVKLTYTVNGTSNDLPISFYVLQQCSAQDSFIRVEVNDVMAITFNSLVTERSKSLSDWYFLENTTLTVTITTDVLPSYPADQCIAFLVGFNDFNKFASFIMSSSLKNDYYFKECITNERFQVKILTFSNQSYYYLGLYINISTEVSIFVVHINGSYLQYNTSKPITACSATPLSTSCQFSPDVISQDTCLVGLVPPTNTFSGAPTATVDVFTAVDSDSTIALYFFSPLIAVILLTIIVSVVILLLLFRCVTCVKAKYMTF